MSLEFLIEKNIMKIRNANNLFLKLILFRPEHLPISDNNVTTTNDHLEAADYDNESDIDVSFVLLCW